MADFDQLKRHLDEQFPGSLTCKMGKNGDSAGLLIKCPAREGHVFVSAFARDGSALLSLYDSAEDNNPEVWTIMRADEAAQRIQPWAFPKDWTCPRPIDVVAQRKRLEHLIRGLAERNGHVECRVVTSNHNLLRLLTDDARKQLEHDVELVRSEKIISNFPWDEDGHLSLKTAVVLRRYETTERPGKNKEVCLAAIGPELRSDDQLIRVQLLDLIVNNQDYRWESCDWLWTESEAPPEFFWGADAVLEAGAAAQSKLLGIDTTHLAEPELAAHSVRLLDAGFIEEALAIYGVTLSENLHRLIGGQRIAPPACCSHPDESWRRALVEGLRQCAPWLLPQAVSDECRRIAEWSAEDPARKPPAALLKLIIFPDQFHSRKACVMLTADADGREPRLVIETTDSNDRLHASAWKRPLSVESARAGVQILEHAGS